MTKEREALKLALERLKEWVDHSDCPDDKQAITAIKEVLAQPEQEPDYYGLTADRLWMSISKDHYDRLKPEYRMTCFTTPPQRTWVGLTDEEIALIDWESLVTKKDCVQAIETKIKEKNNG